MKNIGLSFSIFFLFLSLANAQPQGRTELDLSLPAGFFIEQAIAATPIQQRLINEVQLNGEHCDHCPEHLNLASDMMKILQHLNSPVRFPRKLEDARLKYLYYTVKHELPDGTERCQRYSSLEEINTRFHSDELSVVSEQILDLPNLHEVLIAPFQNNHTVYTFRGEGIDRDLLMELIVSKDGEARLRTYQYKSRQEQKWEQLPLPSTNTQQENAAGLSWGNEVVTIAIDPKATSLRSDETSLIANENRTSLAQDLDVIAKRPTAEATQITITESQGRPWMLISAQSSDDLNQHELVTAAPMSIMIDEQSKLRINTTLKNEVQLARSEETIALDHAQGATLDLSTDQHRFIGLEVYQRESNNYNRIAVFNDFQVSQGSSIGSRYEEDNQGNRVMSLTNTTKTGQNSQLQLEAGHRNSEVFMTVRSQHQISERTSFSIGAANSEKRKNEFVLQFTARF